MLFLVDHSVRLLHCQYWLKTFITFKLNSSKKGNHCITLFLPIPKKVFRCLRYFMDAMKSIMDMHVFFSSPQTLLEIRKSFY